jgi:hypothetical protein
MKARLLYRILELALLSSLVLSGVSAQSVPISAAEPSAPQDTLPFVRIEGYVSSLTSRAWTVGEFTVQIDASTRIIEKRAHASVGAWVILWATTAESGQLLADLIYVDRAAGQAGSTLQFSAVLNKKSQKWWTINGEAVQIMDYTVITGDPQINDLVWVTAERFDTIVQASAIDRLATDPNEIPVEFEGQIAKITSDLWRIQGTLVRVGPSTLVVGEPALGRNAEVTALQDENGPPLAQIIRVLDEPAEVVLGAMVAAITPEGSGSQAWDMIVFPDKPWSDPHIATVEVDSNALVDESRAVARPGQWAEVHALPLDPSAYRAAVIRLEQPVPVALEGNLQVVQGVAAPVASNWFQIDGRPVWIPEQSAAVVAVRCDGKASRASVEGLLLGNGVIWATQVRFP